MTPRSLSLNVLGLLAFCVVSPSTLKAEQPPLEQQRWDEGQRLRRLGRPREALVYFEKILSELQRRSDAQAHADLALCHFYLGGVRADLEQYSQALEAIDRSIALYRKASPKGHPHLAAVYVLQGAIHLHLEDKARAAVAFQRALQTERRFLRQLISITPEAQALALEARTLAFARHRQPSLHGYLTATRDVVDTDRQAYQQVWEAKNLYTHFLKQQRTSTQKARRSILALLRDRHESDSWANYSGVQLLHYLNQTSSPPRETRVETPPAWTLAEKLPRGTVFLDFVRYSDFSQPKRVRDYYTVFVIRSGKSIERVELQDAVAIDATVRTWRERVLDPNALALDEAVRRSHATAIEREGRKLRDLVWKPIVSLLPKDTRRIYIAPDGELAGLPFAALPGARAGTVLLEEPYSIGYVPDGQFLLDKFLYPLPKPLAAPGSWLAMGDVDYGPAAQDEDKFERVVGTGKFLDWTQPLRLERYCCVLRRDRPTPDRLAQEMPKYRYIHLATHAEAPRYADNDRESKQPFEGWLFQPSTITDPDLALPPSPLASVRVICAGADGSLLGTRIANLELFETRLAVVHACRTGKGRYVMGEGVQSVQRAFHLAKCPNVIGSLWNAKDMGTAILMYEFYYQLWVRRKPPIEALKEAQLKLYRNPKLAVSGDLDLGPPSKVSSGKPIVVPTEDRTSRAARGPTQIWAAFVLSGLGEWQDCPVPELIEAGVASRSSAGDLAPASERRFWLSNRTIVLVSGGLAVVLLLAAWVYSRTTSG